MSKLKEVLRILALALVCLILGMVVWGLHHLWPTIETTLRDTHTTVLEIGLTGKNLREASLEWKKASMAQAAATTDSLTATKDAMRAGKTAFDKVGVAAEHLTVAIDAQSAGLAGDEKALQASIEQMTVTIVALRPVVENLAKITGDPQWLELLAEMNQSLKNIQDATNNANLSTEQVYKVVKYEADKIMRPLTKMQLLLKGLFFGVEKAAQIHQAVGP